MRPGASKSSKLRRAVDALDALDGMDVVKVLSRGAPTTPRAVFAITTTGEPWDRAAVSRSERSSVALHRPHSACQVRWRILATGQRAMATAIGLAEVAFSPARPGRTRRVISGPSYPACTGFLRVSDASSAG